MEPFQKSFSFMGDLPSTVYFDFETTTDGSVIDDKKIDVISYCQVYTSHQNLKTPKIVVFRSFQQVFNEFTSLNHFFQEHIPFFDYVTMAQMKDAAMRVFYREKRYLWQRFSH